MTETAAATDPQGPSPREVACEMYCATGPLKA